MTVVFTEMKDPERLEALAVLLQFDLPRSAQDRIETYWRARGSAIVPLLEKHRDAPFVLPKEYQYSVRLPPAERKTTYDTLLAKITGINSFGLRREVASLLRPVLEELKEREKGGDDHACTEVKKLVRMRTPASDEALVILLDYDLGFHCSDDVNQEIFRRGAVLLKWLRKYQSNPAYSLAAAYPDAPQQPGVERSKLFAWFIERIEVGAKR